MKIFQSMFEKAVQQAPPAYWASAGVHPTAAGHLLLVKCWLQQTERL